MNSRSSPRTGVNLRLLQSGDEPVILPPDWIVSSGTSLVGRADDIAAVSSLVREPNAQLVTLTGPGGVGKTRLALAVAQAAGDAFADGVVFVPLARIATDDLVCAAIARALDLRVMGDTPALDRIAEHLADKRLLLVLDNFEHVAAASTRLAHLLHKSPGVTALVTSRVRLRLSLEQEYPVLPLALPDGKGELLASPAVQLFLARMPTRGAPTLAHDEAAVATAAGIVSHLDGLPLAIELAAARTSVLPPQALLERLAQRLPLLTGGSRDLPPRQQTMRNTIAWSYDLLQPDEQRVFRALAVFHGGFSLAAAERLGQTIGFRDRLGVIDILTSLMDHSLVQRAPEAGGQPRYTLFETVREFGRERLLAHGEAPALDAMHGAVTLAGAEIAAPELYGAAQGAWLDALEADHPNLRATLTWAADHDPAVALRLCCALLRYWPIRGYLAEGRLWLERAIAACEAEPAPATDIASGRVALAWIRYWQGDFAAGETLARSALATFQDLDVAQGQADALRVLGHLQVGQAWRENPPDPSVLQEAVAAFTAQRDLWQQLGSDAGVAMAHHNLGFVALNRGQTDSAAKLLEDAVARFAALGDRWSLALSLTYLANIDLAHEDAPHAAARLEEALAIYAELRDQWKVAYALDAAAQCLQRHRRQPEAMQLASAAEALLRRGGVSYIRAHAAGTEQFQPPGNTVSSTDSAGTSRQLGLEEAIALVRQWLAELASSVAVAMQPGLPPLTERERDVLRLLAQGLSDRRIAAELQISPRTVGGHVTRILGKLHVESRTAAATYAVRHGLS